MKQRPSTRIHSFLAFWSFGIWTNKTIFLIWPISCYTPSKLCSSSSSMTGSESDSCSGVLGATTGGGTGAGTGFGDSAPWIWLEMSLPVGTPPVLDHMQQLQRKSPDSLLWLWFLHLNLFSPKIQTEKKSWNIFNQFVLKHNYKWCVHQTWMHFVFRNVRIFRLSFGLQVQKLSICNTNTTHIYNTCTCILPLKNQIYLMSIRNTQITRVPRFNLFLSNWVRINKLIFLAMFMYCIYLATTFSK